MPIFLRIDLLASKFQSRFRAPSLVIMSFDSPGRVRQVLTNLLSNAIKFTQHGSVTISITTVDVMARKAESLHDTSKANVNNLEEKEDDGTMTLQFVCEDTGCGIDAEMIPKLFNAFVQEDSSTARRYGGTGLGLNISKQLVELMGGRISLDSTVGIGTKVSFAIPFKISHTKVDMSDTSASKLLFTLAVQLLCRDG